jgi:hypothetical protein
MAASVHAIPRSQFPVAMKNSTPHRREHRYMGCLQTR